MRKKEDKIAMGQEALATLLMRFARGGPVSRESALGVEGNEKAIQEHALLSGRLG